LEEFGWASLILTRYMICTMISTHPLLSWPPASPRREEKLLQEEENAGREADEREIDKYLLFVFFSAPTLWFPELCALVNLSIN
jgi:glycine cleavage system protein P-like pyridoxal-binding family